MEKAMSARRSPQSFTCALFLFLGTVFLQQVQNTKAEMKICPQTVPCMGDRYTGAILSRNKTILCRELKWSLECLTTARASCGGFDRVTQSAFDTFTKNYQNSCPDATEVGNTARPRVQNTPSVVTSTQCLEKMQACLTSDLLRAQEESDAEKICQLGEVSVACMEEVQVECDRNDEEMKSFINSVKYNVSKGCDDSGKTGAVKTDDFSCSNFIKRCSDSEVLRSELKNEDENQQNKVCRMAPKVYECIDQWQEKCFKNSSQAEKNMVKSVRQNLKETCNSGVTLQVFTPLMLMCLVVLLKQLFTTS